MKDFEDAFHYRIPTPVSGNIYAETVMIAEKGSDLIKSDYGFFQNLDSNPICTAN